MEDNGMHPDNYFYVSDGTVLTSVEDLFQVLQEMPHNVFSQHVNDDKNDFYNWVKDVFENHRLAMNIKYAKEKDEILKHVFMSLFG